MLYKPGFPFGGSGDSGQHKQLQLALPAPLDEAGLPVPRVRRQRPARAAAALAPGTPDEAGLPIRRVRDRGRNEQLQLAHPALQTKPDFSSARPVTAAGTSSCNSQSFCSGRNPLSHSARPATVASTNNYSSHSRRSGRSQAYHSARPATAETSSYSSRFLHSRRSRASLRRFRH
ncbi:hypothetical protein [Paenibacillus tepidiphilus]|uniref:hypothetical protein n=1 Tax=Paenibacillus tepidiphilus TaxID=2608683 RepID=UPI00123876F6|nr:hypothetical protein [Paenibacillus tepidiphilus]